jgi:hypothetical protein
VGGTEMRQRMYPHEDVPRAVMEELTSLTLQGYADNEFDGVCSELRRMILRAMQGRREHGGIRLTRRQR